MKATISAILDGKRYKSRNGERYVELHFEEAEFAFQTLRVPERSLDLGKVEVGTELDVNFLPERLMDEVNRALAEAQQQQVNRCPWCGETFVELGEGKLSHWCAEESKVSGRAQ